MLEKLPHAVGEALSALKAGLDKAAAHADFADVPSTITVTSDAFADGGAIPARYTEDGERTSPPIAWTGVPAGAACVVVLVEDVDSPSINPLVHLIAWNLPPRDGALPEDAIAGATSEGGRLELGRNSFQSEGWLPPDPPTGHGVHRYLFQVYAVDAVPDVSSSPGRGAVVAAMAGHVLAKGVLTGTYQRG